MNRFRAHQVIPAAFGLSMALALGVDRTHAVENAPPRAAKPNLKANELYCSYDKKAKKWSFAVLPGTNRLNTPAEVKAALTIEGIDDLKKKLAELAKGDSVFCYGMTLGSRSGLGLKTYMGLMKFCKSKKIAFR